MKSRLSRNTLIMAMPLLIILVAFIGCNKPTESRNGGGLGPFSESAKIYPHSEDFKSKEHGSLFLRDKALCSKCHGADLQGGTAQSSCTTCHQGFPHAAQWSLQANHGVFVSKGGDSAKTSCATCHSPSKNNGLTSCQQCHSTYPHQTDWMDPSNHGKAFVAGEAVDQKSCLTCHNGKADSQVISCQTCHEQFPHVKNWSNPKKHGETYGKLPQDQKAGACLGCHTNTETSKKSVTCQQCHSEIFPHTAEFKSPFDNLELHMKHAVNPQSKCVSCHQGYTKYMNAEKGGCRECHTTGETQVKWVEIPSPAPQ